MNLPTKMSLELVAISMIGDGMLALTQPQRHMRLWNAGPEPWRRLCTYFEERPAQTMIVGALFVGAGLWLASQQDQEGRERLSVANDKDVSARTHIYDPMQTAAG